MYESVVIESNDLHRIFNGIEAMAGGSFQVEHGEIFGLLGPNTTGKTTIIRLQTGYIAPSGGQASITGRDLVEDRQCLISLIGGCLR